MAKKRRSGGGEDYTGIMKLAAFVAVLAIALIITIRMIFRWVNWTPSGLMSALGLIELVASTIALGLGGWMFVRGKSSVWKTIFIVALIIWIVFGVLNIFNVGV